MRLDPDERPTCSQLLKHDFFMKDNFSTRFAPDLKARVQKEQMSNPLLKSPSNDDDNKDNDKVSPSKKKKKGTVAADTKDTKDAKVNTNLLF